MAALDFPANPSDGDSYEPSGVGIRYVFSSGIGAWQAAADSISGFLAISGGEITGNLIIDQNLTVTGTTTFVGTTTASTVTGTTANFISGNFDQLTATSGTFSSSVGFSTVTGNAASFTTITGDSYDAGNGAEATPSYSFTSDQDLGLFRPGANTLGVSTSGTERARFTESGSFMVGGAAESGSTYTSQFTAYAEGNILTSSINTNVFDLETTTTGNAILALRSNVGGNDTTVATFTADGSATFSGLVTAGSGVNVAGGSATDVTNGFFFDSNRIATAHGGGAGFSFGGNGDSAFGFKLDDGYQLSTTTTAVSPIQVTYSGAGHTSSQTYNGIDSRVNNQLACSNINLFNTFTNTAQTGDSITYVGYRSGLNSNMTTGSGSATFNFYAGGNAPNYFAGLTELAGGTVVNGGTVRRVTIDITGIS